MGDRSGAERSSSDKSTRPSGGDEELDTRGSLTPGAAGWLAMAHPQTPRRVTGARSFVPRLLRRRGDMSFLIPNFRPCVGEAGYGRAG